MLNSFDPNGRAVVLGASGGIGAALASALEASASFSEVHACARGTELHFDLLDETSIANLAVRLSQDVHPIRLVVNATGCLENSMTVAEKRISQLDPEQMLYAFRVNAIGPALLMKHFMPLLADTGKSVFACLSARVGSIGDNHLGGWYSYRASKAALNQLVHTAALELRRSRKEAICVALHPGTVSTRLSKNFSKTGLNVQTPEEAALRLLTVMNSLKADQTGGFFDHNGLDIPW